VIRLKKNPNAQLAPIAAQECPPTGHIFLSRLAETSKKAAKYRIDSVALPLFIE
jgi:hypothetical protein